VVASNIVPFDSISIEIVQHSKTGLFMRGNLSSGSVVRLGQTSASGMRPVSRLVKRHRGTTGVGPEHGSLRVIHNTTSPEISLGVLGN